MSDCDPTKDSFMQFLIPFGLKILYLTHSDLSNSLILSVNAARRTFLGEKQGLCPPATPGFDEQS
jgi:hypothetical protein